MDVNLPPLPPAALHILAALASGPLHGYGIMQEAASQSEGRYKLGPGTLYGNLEKLLGLTMIEEAAAPSAEADPRRRYYRLTSFGRQVLEAEVRRLENVVRAARAGLHPAKRRSS